MRHLQSLFAVVVTFAPLDAAWAQPTFTVLNGGTWSVASKITPDGSTVAGTMYTTGYRGYRWTASGGTEPLGVLPGMAHSRAHLINADGSGEV